MGNDANSILGLFPSGDCAGGSQALQGPWLGWHTNPSRNRVGGGGSTTVDEVKMNQKAGWSRQMRDYNLCTTEPEKADSASPKPASTGPALLPPDLSTTQTVLANKALMRCQCGFYDQRSTKLAMFSPEKSAVFLKLEFWAGVSSW